MTVSLHDAVVALDKRKQTITPERAPEVALDSDEARFMVLGFDLEVPDLFRHGQHVGLYTAKYTSSVVEASQAAWMDGVLTGLMLAELRRGERVA